MIAHIIVPSVDWWTGLDNLFFRLLPPANFTFHCNINKPPQYYITSSILPLPRLSRCFPAVERPTNK